MRGGDAVVIGGGAAGIAAARVLHDAKSDVLLVEADEAIGGRARTAAVDGFALDLGCGWLHSAARNPWMTLAEQYGFTVDRSDPRWREQWRDLGYSPVEQRAFTAAWARWSAAARAALGRPDRPLSDFIADDDPSRPLIDAISAYVNGAPLDRVSLHDWAAYEDAAGEENWAVREGYGALVARHADGIPRAFGTVVRRIDHRGAMIRIETDRGAIEARRAIVAVPTTMLASGALAFDPPLPAKQAAAEALPLGLADKVFLRVAGDTDWPASAHLIGNPRSAHTASYRLSPFGWPVIECFFGGDCAEALDAAGGGAAADFAIGELVHLLGSDWRARFAPLATTRWRAEPWIGGSYSHARVGSAGQRRVLAEPVDGRIFFAGEACSTSDFSTAHGAYETGNAAARAVLATMARDRVVRAGSARRWTRRAAGHSLLSFQAGTGVLMWKWIKIAKIVALLAFVLPWMTVSCSGTRLVSASGFGLAFGGFTTALPASQGAPTSGPGVDVWLVLALVAIVAGIVVAFRPFSRPNALLVTGLSAAGVALVWLGTARFSKSAILAEAGKRRGATGDMDDLGARMDSTASAMVQIDWQIGFYLALLALIAAGVMAWIAYSGREAAVERSLRDAVASARQRAAGAGPPATADAPAVICPKCGRSYPAATRFCPEDGTPLA